MGIKEFIDQADTQVAESWDVIKNNKIQAILDELAGGAITHQRIGRWEWRYKQ